MIEIKRPQKKAPEQIKFWRPRLLPIFIAMIGLMIFDRTWNLISGNRGRPMMTSQVHAENKAADSEPRREIKTEKDKSPAPVSKLKNPESNTQDNKEVKEKHENQHEHEKKDTAEDSHKKSNELSEADILSTFDPMQMSESQIKLLLSLSDRRKQIEQKEDKLTQDSAALVLIEKRIDEQLKKLEDIKNAIESTVQKNDEEQDKKIAEVVKIYEGMKPAAAAGIFNELPLSILAPLVQKMNKRKVSAIIAQMDVKKAKKLTTKLAQKDTLEDEADNEPVTNPTAAPAPSPAPAAKAGPSAPPKAPATAAPPKP